MAGRGDSPVLREEGGVLELCVHESCGLSAAASGDLEDALRVFDYDCDGALCAPELAAAIAASGISSTGTTTSARDAASAAARAIARFDASGKGALRLVEFLEYASSSESALCEVPYGAHAIGPEAAVKGARVADPGSRTGAVRDDGHRGAHGDMRVYGLGADAG
jgi:hypothetical protein